MGLCLSIGGPQVTPSAPPRRRTCRTWCCRWSSPGRSSRPPRPHGGRGVLRTRRRREGEGGIWDPFPRRGGFPPVHPPSFLPSIPDEKIPKGGGGISEGGSDATRSRQRVNRVRVGNSVCVFEGKTGGSLAPRAGAGRLGPLVT